MITLSNGTLTVTISTRGAEIKSIKDANGVERQWEGNPAIWAGQAPLMFPIAGGLKEDKYTFEGKEYQLQKHGYGRFCEFAVENCTQNTATFRLFSDEESRTHFPFDYTLRVKYALVGDRIEITYDVQNRDSKTMYFSIGSHEAYACPEGIDQYEVVFDQPETADAYVLDGNLLNGEHIPMLNNTKVFPLDYKYFAVDALVFLDIQSRGVTLQSKLHDRKIRVDFPGCDYFLLWTKPNAPYICMEPWCGVQDFVGSSYDITQKRGILTLPAGETLVRKHTITVL